MKHFIDNIDEQILRYYRNELSNDEEKLLLSWVNENDSNKKYFREQLIIAETIIQKNIRFDTNKGYSEFIKETGIQERFKRIKLALPVAAAILIALCLFTFYLSRSGKSSKQLTYTSLGSNIEVILSDSSLITLRQGAVLKAPKEFSNKQRVVEFEGQAYFNIKSDDKRSFSILIENIAVEVLGTSFEIKTDSVNDNVEIRVESGTVKVVNRKYRQTYILQKDQQLIVNQHTDYNEHFDLIGKNYLAWKTGQLSYQGARMEKVLADLSELYRKKIVFSDSTLNDCEVTFSINNQSFDEVLLMLEKLLTVEVFSLDSVFVLAGKDNSIGQ